MSQRTADQTMNDADVAIDDVNTLSGLLEVVAILMTSIQTTLDKVRLILYTIIVLLLWL